MRTFIKRESAIDIGDWMDLESSADQKHQMVVSVDNFAKQLATYIEDPAVQVPELRSVNGRVTEFFRLVNDTNALDLGEQDTRLLYETIASFTRVVAKKHQRLKGKTMMADVATKPVRSEQEAGQLKEQIPGKLKQAESTFREMLKPESVVRESESENTPQKISDTPHQLDKRGIFTYHEQVWKDANGREFNRSYIDFGNAAMVLPIDADGNIMLIRQHRTPANEGNGEWLFEAIAGKIDRTKSGTYETPEENAAKEASEEGGLKLRELKAILSGYSSPGRASEKAHIFYAEVEEEGTRNLQGHETILKNFERVKPARALEMIASGEIADIKTIAAIQGYVEVLIDRELKKRGIDGIRGLLG